MNANSPQIDEFASSHPTPPTPLWIIGASVLLFGVMVGCALALRGEERASVAFDVTPDGHEALVCDETARCRYVPLDGSGAGLAPFRLRSPAIAPDGTVYGIRAQDAATIVRTDRQGHLRSMSEFEGAATYVGVTVGPKGELVAVRTRRGVADLELVAFHGGRPSVLGPTRHLDALGLGPGAILGDRLYCASETLDEDVTRRTVAVDLRPKVAGRRRGVKPIGTHADASAATCDAATGRVFFTSYDTGFHGEVWTMAPDGSGERRIVRTSSSIDGVRPLPGGTRIVVACSPDGTRRGSDRLRVYEIATGALIREILLP